jgi:hypothetical protein
MNFKIGDEVEVVWDDKGDSKYIGSVSKIESIIEDYSYPYKLEMFAARFKKEELKLTNKNMNIKEQFTLAMTPEPQKSFRKVGITNGDNILTEDGMKIYLSWKLMKDADAFKKEVVDDMLAEQEKGK